MTAIALPGVELFEMGLVWEVFGQDRTGDGVPLVSFTVATTSPGAVMTSAGVPVQVDRDLAAVDEADLVVALPTWHQSAPVPEAVLDALRRTVERGARVLSICGGAFALGQAGLLDGRRATTHWRNTDELAASFPRAHVEPGVLYVDAGQVVTSAGTSAGIDAALHVVRQELGPQAAAAIARRMVVPPHRSGGQAQYVAAPVPERVDGDLAPLLDWVVAHLDADLGVAALARRAGLAPRTFVRRFGDAVGTTPASWVAGQRLARARELLEASDLSVEEVARRVGWGSAAVLRHHFAALGTTPLAYRRAFSARAAAPGGPVRPG